MRKYSGEWIITPLDGGKVVTLPTMQCGHCGCHWIFRPGSRAKRGICTVCCSHTCGKPECDPCVPYEARMENVEAGRQEVAPRRIIAASGYERLAG